MYGMAHGAGSPDAAPAGPAAEKGLTRDNPLDLDTQAIAPSPQADGWAFAAAGLFSAFWAGGIVAYVVGYYGKASFANLPWTGVGLFAAAAFVPSVMAWFMALMQREARLLRRQTNALIRAAESLSKPNDTAAKGVAQLGRSIRKELEQINSAVENAQARLTALHESGAEQLQALERSAAQARDRVDTAAQRLGAERDKLQTFASALDDAVTSAGENLSARVDDAKAAAKAAAEGLKGEQAAIGALLESVNAAASAAAQRAAEMAKEVDREAQKLDAASEAAAARSEQVIQRHERHRAALTETLDRLKAENDHMTRTLEAQRDGLGKLIMVMSEEAKRIDGFATDGVRRIDAATATMSKRVVELASTLSAEIEKLRSQSELSSTGIDQAVQSIKAAGDSSYSSASMLGAQLTQVTETAAKATLAVDAGISRLAQLMNDLPRDVQTHAEQMRGVVEGQALAINDLTGRIANAFEQLQTLEQHKLTSKPASPVAQPQPRPEQSAASVPPPPPPSNENLPVLDLQTPLVSEHGPSEASAPGTDNPDLKGDTAAQQELRSWFGIAKRLVRGPDGTPADAQAPPPAPPAAPRGWDMRQLLQAADQTGAQPPPFDGPANPRHMLESLQSQAIDIDRFLEDDPPLDLLRRYRAGERDIFLRRLIQILGRENNERLARKYQNDLEFQEAVSRYCQQYEVLIREASVSDPALADQCTNGFAGRIYAILAPASGRR